ncbi:sensor histidine kinase, partial [Bacteroidota bacterium]
NERDLIMAKEKAEESDRLKSSFLATMSHELRTPLNAIIGFSSLIDESISTSEITEFSKIINSSGLSLLNLIEEIFDISVIEAGQVKLNISDFRLDIITSEIQNLIEIEKENQVKNDLDIIINPDPRIQFLTINTDQHKLKQILINLLKNALKFTENGFIEFGYYPQYPDEVHFYVKDTGIGIPKEKQEIIFDRFRQADETTTRKYGGTGLGLAISKKLVELLNGRIWVESEHGQVPHFLSH